MELDLLRIRAENIPSVTCTCINEGLDGEFRLLPGESFSCSGTMTGLLLVGTIMTDGERDKYPEIQIWRNTGGNTTYTRQASQEIRLAAGDFSPDGVLQYNLTTPISYQSGDVLGVYQPLGNASVVIVYRDFNVSSITYQDIIDPSSPINLIDLSLVNEHIFISPISG